MKHSMMVVALLGLAPIAGCKKSNDAVPTTGSGAVTSPAEPKPAEPKLAEPAPAPAAAGPAWETATSKEGKFTVELPGKPNEQKQGAMTILGAEFGTTATDDRTAMCGAVFVELPAVPPDVKQTFDGATLRHKDGATVVEEKDVKLGDVPGRHLVVENASHRKYMRLYIKGSTMYLVNCGGPFDRAATDGPIATRVLESFKLL